MQSIIIFFPLIIRCTSTNRHVKYLLKGRHYNVTVMLVKQDFWYSRLCGAFRWFSRTHASIFFNFRRSMCKHIQEGICLPANFGKKTHNHQEYMYIMCTACTLTGILVVRHSYFKVSALCLCASLTCSCENASIGIISPYKTLTDTTALDAQP